MDPLKLILFILSASIITETDGGVMSELDASFGSFAHWVQKKKDSQFPAPSEASRDLKDEMNQLPLEDRQQNFEQLPQPMHLKDVVKGYIREDGTYIVEDSSDTPCIMAFFKARITVYFPINRKEEKYDNRIISPPNDVEVSGSCDRDSLIAVLDLKWSKGTFSIRFAYDDLIDSWFADQFKFAFDSSVFKGADKKENVMMVSDPKRRFWTTTHAKSFRCLLMHDVSLTDDNDVYSGTIHFDEARVQALTKTSVFKRPKHCIHRVHRDEMVPITVGASLVILTLVTIAGYGAFRYFKVKKFQYGGME